MTEVLDLNQVLVMATEARQNADEAFKLVQAAGAAKRELQKLIEGFAEKLGVTETLRRLESLPTRIADASTSLAQVEATLCILKQHLHEAKEDVDLAITEATTEAYATETVNGRNAEIRQVQLNAWLDKSAGVKAARENLAINRRKAVDLEAKVIQAKATYKARTGALNAACHAAELQAALLFTTRDEEV